jgi:DNA-binding CsgD family transcriptional regulator
MLAEAGIDHVGSLDIRNAITTARDAYNVATRASPGAQAFAGSMLAAALTLNGERAEANALLGRILPQLRDADPLTEAGRPVFLAAQSYSWLERYDLASELLDRLIASARQASAPAALPIPLTCRADLDLRLGRWTVAAAEAEEAVSLSEEIAQPAITAYALECLARLAAAGGERRCRDHAAHAMRIGEERHSDIARLYVHSALGLLELGLGRIDAAIRQLELVQDLAARRGLAEPNVVHWQADLIEAYLRAGRPDAARDALDRYHGQAERTGGRWARGTAARCRGLVAEEEEADAHFAAALEHLEPLPSPFEVARTHLCHGERLRRAGRRTDARQPLRLAIEGFDQLGAGPWATRARAELRATGATPRRRRNEPDRDQLTAHELQVALIVAAGASNREAAAALFLSPKTIEFHLARIYRKLGLRTRSELAAIAARRGWLDGGALHARRATARQAPSP